MPTLSNLFQSLHAAGVLSVEDHAVLSATLSTRGKYKGNLRSSAPKGATERGAWRAIMIDCAPSRVGIGALLMGDNEEREAFHRYESLLSTALHGHGKIVFAVLMPFRFNALALRYECNDLQRLIETLVSLHASIPTAEVSP